MEFNALAAKEASALVARVLGTASQASLQQVDALRAALDSAVKALEASVADTPNAEQDVEELVKRLSKAATAEADTIKADLEKARAQKNALEQQVKSLKDANGKLTADSEFMSAELQRIKDSRDKERSSIDTRGKELEQKVKEMSAQHRMLKQEYEDVKKHNETLKSTVARYQKELKSGSVRSPCRLFPRRSRRRPCLRLLPLHRQAKWHPRRQRSRPLRPSHSHRLRPRVWLPSMSIQRPPATWSCF